MRLALVIYQKCMARLRFLWHFSAVMRFHLRQVRLEADYCCLLLSEITAASAHLSCLLRPSTALGLGHKYK